MAKIRVTLRWIQIKDQLEPFYKQLFKQYGEFFFHTRVETGNQIVEFRLPEEGHWEISDHPRFNKVDKIDQVMFEGEPGPSLTVQLFGEELDRFSKNDQLDPYRKEFTGPPEEWVGRHAPGDEGSDDPENLANWRICYDIEMA
ncbi:MAG TPA: hypothetical protein VGA70_10890 [Longimicrobiales bacterium]|jgi:hypothetical protein